jgi:prepilin-type N-terminal cleavage/methylation domain-containing protein
MRIERSNSFQRGARTSAFTLIEVVVAVAVSALLMAGSFTGYNVAGRQVQYSACNLSAGTMCMGEIEKFLADTPTQLLGLPTSGTQPTNLCLPISGSNIVTCTNFYWINNVSANPPYAVIQLQCVWNNGFGVCTNTVTVMRALNL